MVTGVGLRACARELGISHVALLKAVRTGRVAKLADGTFDVETCRKSLDLNSHPVKSEVARRQQKPKHPEPVVEKRKVIEIVRPSPPPEKPAASRGEPPSTTDPPPPDPGNVSISEAARQLEWEKLRAIKLKIDREAGKLVDIEVVNAYVAGMIIMARDELVRIGPELRERLAQESDPVACESMVIDRVSQALEKLSVYSGPA